MNLVLLCFLLLSILVSSAAGCDRCIHNSKAEFFGNNPATIGNGACGYKDQALLLSPQGFVGIGSPRLFRQGAGCGACYQIRCKDPDICAKTCIKVVLTDSQGDGQTDFVLAAQAFSAMAKAGKAQALHNKGVVDIEYKSVPCQYKPNMAVRVEEQTNKPYYLAIKFLYQGGQTDIQAVEVAPVRSNNWFPLRRSYGAVWDTTQNLSGALKIRVAVTSGNNVKWVTAKKMLPTDWKKGVIYDTGVQITDIAQEKCYPCDSSIWACIN